MAKDLPARPVPAPAALRGWPGALLPGLTLAAVAAGLYLGLAWAPAEATQGEVYRVLYIHVPSAWAAFASFSVTFVASLLYLRRREPRWDMLALSGAELGLLFTTAVLLTGSIWARFAWGTWWTWDPRLTTTLVLWFLYAGYLVLREAIDDPERRARLAAVLGIVAFLDVPVVYVSIRIWRTIHPVVFQPGEERLDPAMAAVLLVNGVAFLLLFAWLLQIRYRLEVTRRRARELQADRAGGGRAAPAGATLGGRRL